MAEERTPPTTGFLFWVAIAGFMLVAAYWVYLILFPLGPLERTIRDDRSNGSHDPPAVWFAYTPDRKGAHP